MKWQSKYQKRYHRRHCMLFEFHKGTNATVTTVNICFVYSSALNVCKCQRWYSKFRWINFDLLILVSIRKTKYSQHCAIGFLFIPIATTLFTRKKMQNHLISKMLSLDILLDNKLIFIDPALKFCKLDGKRLLIARVITSFIKSKNLLKFICLNFM